MNRIGLASLVLTVLALTAIAQKPADIPEKREQVGPTDDNGFLVATGQLIHPAGESVDFKGRPVDLVLSPDGRRIYVKDNRGLVVIETATWKLSQELPFPRNTGGGSMHGVAVSEDGKRVYATTSQAALHEAGVGEDGKLTWLRQIALPGPEGKGASHATGIALSSDGKRVYVCLSRNNSLAIVDLQAGKLVEEIPVGVAPFDVVLARDGMTAYVSNWGGRRALRADKTANSSGTPVVVDARGVAASGTVGRVDLKTKKMTDELAVGLHPSDLQLSPDGATLFVANANSDTVDLIDTGSFAVRQSLLVRPDPTLPFGSATNALMVTPDGKTLLAANGGNNAVAVISLTGLRERPAKVEGFIPTGWYPGGLACDGKHIYVCNIKGEGSRTKPATDVGYSVYGYRGTVGKIEVPGAAALATFTKNVKQDAHVPQILLALEKGHAGVEPVPVPAKLGEPSVFEHVIYVIKENRTYDQVFGDMKKGNNEPKLCIYPRNVTPNHHALAEEFVLLDNFYCNGVLSADGHSWATEGNVTDHLEKAFGGFTRSYTFGNDPLTYSSSGFIWDGVLLRGLSFRNYGEMVTSDAIGKAPAFADIWKDYKAGNNAIEFKHKIEIETLAKYTSPDYPGWNMRVTDNHRMDVFLKEFKDFEKKGTFPNFTIMYLPQDHTSGASPNMPTPNAHMADNDLALGRLVAAISQSKFWPKTCIFVVEDDPQNGFDHVDGHRSLSLVISPYTKRGQVVSHFYNQTSVIRTMSMILGTPPLTQLDSSAPPMTDCFVSKPDLKPYKARANNFPLDELNKARAALPGPTQWLVDMSLKQDLSGPDKVDDDEFNRILWHVAKGVDAAYPRDFAGAHGRGLKALGLVLGGKK